MLVIVYSDRLDGVFRWYTSFPSPDEDTNLSSFSFLFCSKSLSNSVSYSVLWSTCALTLIALCSYGNDSTKRWNSWKRKSLRTRNYAERKERRLWRHKCVAAQDKEVCILHRLRNTVRICYSVGLCFSKIYHYNRCIITSDVHSPHSDREHLFTAWAYPWTIDKIPNSMGSLCRVVFVHFFSLIHRSIFLLWLTDEKENL